MSYVGFKIPQVRELAGHLRSASSGTTQLHRDIRQVLDAATDSLAGKPATSSPGLSLVQANIFGIALSPPGSLGSPLHDMAGSIDRRVAHLEKCSQLLKDCKGTVDPALVFADEPPPDPQKASKALEALREMNTKDAGTNGNRDDLRATVKVLEGLTGAELDLLLDQATPEELAKLRGLMTSTGDSGWTPFDANGLPVGERVQFASGLLAKVAPSQMNKVQTAFPWLQPGFESTDVYLDKFNAQTGKATNGMHYGTPTDPLFTNKKLSEDIYQGQFGDCWFIASMTATAQKNPEFLREGIKENPNGTISVRIWDKDGNQRWVTMNKELPLDGNGEPVGARGDGSTWPAYYEKAFAIVYEGDDGGAPDGKEDDPRYDRTEQGTYGALEWDFNEQAPPYLTGNESDGIDTEYDDVKESFDSGHPVIVSTGSGRDDVPDNWSQQQKDAYVNRHVYYVKEFTPDGKIILGNPWGPDSATVTVTKDEFEDLFDSAQQIQVGE